jgi:hypothetical protein
MFISSAVYAAELAGKVNDYHGTVKVYGSEDVRGKKVNEKGYDLFVSDTVKTKRGALASIDFIDGSRVIMKGNSILEIQELKAVEIGKGRVIFNIKKQDELHGLTVRMKSVVIGVKGTKFLIDYSGEKIQIFLKEGSLNVKAVKDNFIRYRKKEVEAFDEYKKAKQKAFQEYKEEQEYQFKEFIKEFDMRGGTAIIIDNGVLNDMEITDDIEKEFLLLDKSFEEYMNKEEDWEKGDEPS